jgi:two-component system response regulator YesN
MYKMMIADDEPAICLGLKKAINWAGIGIEIVALAENGQSALDLYKQHRPQIVLADINMPRLDGLTMLSEIKKHDASTIVIFISAYSKFSYAQRAIELGAFHYLIKPFSEDDLIKVVKQAMNQLKERESTQRMIQYASMAQEQYQRDIILSAATGMIPFKTTVKKALSRTIRLDFAESKCFGLLLKTDNTPDIQQLRTLALSTMKHNRTEGIRFFVLEPCPDELLVIYFFLHDYQPQAEKLCANFTLRAFSQGHSIKAGMSGSHLAANGFPKLYAECGCALITLYEKAPKTSLFQFCHIDCSAKLPNVHQDAFSAIILNAFQSQKKDQIHSACYRLLLQLCSCGRIYHTVDCCMTLVSDIHYFLSKLDWQLSDSIEIHQLDDINDRLQRQMHTNLLNCYTFCINILKELYEIFQNNLHISNHMVKVAVSFIHNNYSQDLSLACISDQLQITPNYLSKLFKEKTGSSFTEYLTVYRLDAAKKMLRSGQYKVYEVAEKVGYSDSQYFSKQFKKNVGVSPKEYINKPII